MDAPTRRDQFRRLIKTRFAGSQTNAAAAIGRSAGRVTQLLDPEQAFGERAARDIEDKLGLPRNWLDQPQSTTPAPVPPAPVPDLAQALPVVLKAMTALSPGQWRMVRARLDDLPEQPLSVPGVLADIAPILGLGPSTVAALLASGAQFETSDWHTAPADRSR